MSRSADPASASLSRPWERPVPVALFSIGTLTLVGWAILFFEAIRRGGGADAFLEALCTPAAVLEAPSLAGALAALGVSIAMWIAMSVAMMLPTASALLVGYAEKAEAARAAGRPAVSPMVVGAGYLAVWVALSILVALLQTGVSIGFAAAELPERLAGVLGGAALGAAGLYQFTAFKLSCLVAVGAPFRARPEGWLASPRAVFRLGVEQGVRCVGCCWAMMAVLVLLGAMNLVWMAVFSAIMAAEKLVATPRAAQIVGAGLLAAGLALSVEAIGLAPIAAYLAR
ncbi:copper chaperone [Salinarimonas sp. NSM]|uniref:copper chaperone n=1 Tax=Salinarimonas sp. NSM TaxID=3458003 RepID=UPI00403736BB